MKQLIPVVLPLVILTAPVPKVAATDEPADVAAIKAVIAAVEQVNNAGDADAWVALFDEGFVYMPHGGPEVVDQNELRALGRAGFTEFKMEIKIVPVEVTVIGDWAIARTRITGRSTRILDNTQNVLDVKELLVLHRVEGGAWKIARLMMNRSSTRRARDHS